MLDKLTHNGEYFSRKISLLLSLIWAILIGLILYLIFPSETYLLILETSNKNNLVHQSGLLTWEYRIVVECIMLVIGALIFYMFAPMILFVYPILMIVMLFNGGDWKIFIQIPILVPIFAFLFLAPKKIYEKQRLKKNKHKPKPIIKKASAVTAKHLNEKKSSSVKPLNTIDGKLGAILTQVESLTFSANTSDRDVQMGLSTITMNCRQAIAALKKGIDDIGNTITPREVGKGLRLLWVNFGVGWIDIVKSKMGAAEHKKLIDILEQIKKIAGKLEK